LKTTSLIENPNYILPQIQTTLRFNPQVFILDFIERRFTAVELEDPEISKYQLTQWTSFLVSTFLF
ncbi:TPA: hypothetical protein ACIZBE_003288, partial [Legionella pneumophila]